MLAFGGARLMETSTAGVTVRLKLARNGPLVAMILAVPGETEVTAPCWPAELLTVATLVFDELQRTLWVALPAGALPRKNIFVVEHCVVSPAASDALPQVTMIFTGPCGWAKSSAAAAIRQSAAKPARVRCQGDTSASPAYCGRTHIRTLVKLSLTKISRVFRFWNRCGEF
jgi:hypothetical protein